MLNKENRTIVLDILAHRLEQRLKSGEFMEFVGTRGLAVLLMDKLRRYLKDTNSANTDAHMEDIACDAILLVLTSAEAQAVSDE